MAKTGKYVCQMKDGTKQEREGLIFNNRWAIEKRQEEKIRSTKDGDKVSLSSYFALTHIPTGILVTTANTQKALKELINREDMIDEDDLHKMAVAVGKFWNEKGWQG